MREEKKENNATVEDGDCLCGHARHDHKQGMNRCCIVKCGCEKFEDEYAE